MGRRILLAVAAVLVLTASTVALPGPEVDLSQLEITFTARDPALVSPVEKQRTYYARNQGWDFGDRSAYRCAWVEFYSNPTDHAAGDELFEVEFHAISDYAVQVPGGNVEITDSGGLEAPDATIHAECWGADDAGTFTADASDHFPHGVDIVFYADENSDGRIDQVAADELARIAYTEPTQPVCGRLYWTDGDEPGEAWLWWDEDGAADMHHHGDGLCGGGPEEPISIVQAQPRNLAAGVAVCSETSEGSLCDGLSPPVTVLPGGEQELRCANLSTPEVLAAAPLIVRCAE